jgi:hypothetical protein
MLAAGQNSSQKAKKGAGEKKLTERIHCRIFCQILLKPAEKGPKKISNEVPYFTVMKNTQRQRKNSFIISY